MRGYARWRSARSSSVYSERHGGTGCGPLESRPTQSCIPSVTRRAVARNFSLELFGHRVRSACSPAAAAAAGIVSTVWLQSIRTVRITVDSDDGKNNHRRWFGIGVDIFAAARAHLVGKSDDFAHCNPPSAPTRGFLETAGPVSSRN